MRKSVHTPEQYEQEYIKKIVRCVWTLRISFCLLAFFTFLSMRCRIGSPLFDMLSWMVLLSGSVMIGSCCAIKWNRFKYKLTNGGVRTLLFFNRIGEGFYLTMVALVNILKARTEYIRIDRQEEKKEALSKGKKTDYSFKDLLIGSEAQRQADALEKIARREAAAYMNDKRKYARGLACVFWAMVKLECIENNQTQFVNLFYREFGRERAKDTYRRTFQNNLRSLDDDDDSIKIREEIKKILKG